MTPLFKEVMQKDAADFLIKQLRDQDTSGLRNYSDGLYVDNFTVRMYWLSKITSPLLSPAQYDMTKEPKELTDLRMEVRQFLARHGKILGYSVNTEERSLFKNAFIKF